MTRDSAYDLDLIGRGLPFLQAVPDLVGAMEERRVVVQAPPGTGKTTVVPPAVAALRPGRVVVTQPRRMAARAAATRLAQLTGTTLGAGVGYTVRGDSRTSPATRVEFCTTGVLLRRLIHDPELRGVGTIVIDEIHERQLDTDLVFAFTRELLELRDDLALVAMSATLDADTFARRLGDAATPAPVVGVPGVLHPLTVEWAPPPAPPQDSRGVTQAFLGHVTRATEAAVRRHPDGDALVFLPGVREVDRVAEQLTTTGREVHRLHGGLPASEQDSILRGGDAPRVIVATAVAESSLTVPGVRLVIDAGLAREPRADAARSMSGLVTVAVSRASAEQRAGRAARLGPGVVVRCYAEDVWSRLVARPRPEMLTADLTGAVLDLACWGSPRGEGLALPDPLPLAATETAERRLRGLGALAADGRPTARGRAMAMIPADPRLARALLDGAEATGTDRAAESVATLASEVRAPGADLLALQRELRGGRGPASSRWHDDVRRFRSLAGEHPPPSSRTEEEALAAATAYAFPDRIARARDGGTAYLLASGTGADLAPGSRLAGQRWLAIADVARGSTTSGAVIRAAVPLDESAALEIGATLFAEDEQAGWVDGRVSARRTRRLGAIELTSTPVRPSPESARRAVVDALRAQGLDLLQWSDGARDLRRRLALVHAQLGDPWPAMDDASLLEHAEVWLAPELDRLALGVPASKLDLTGALRRLLPWPEAARLDELAPAAWTAPTGSRIMINYPDDHGQNPVVAVKLQECFGLAETPRIMDGRVPLVFHLLSPARRPLAVTADLASFWAHAYAGVRAENRGRYSKHPWPDDPTTAPPRRGTTASGR